MTDRLFKLADAGIFHSQITGRGNISRVVLVPQLQRLDGLIQIAGDELVVGVREVEALALAHPVAQVVRLPRQPFGA